MSAETPPVPSVSPPAPSHQDHFDDEVFLIGTLQAIILCKEEEGGLVGGVPAPKPCRSTLGHPPRHHAPMSFSQ